MKLFRRISALALVLVIVCAFSASAFALEEWHIIEDYDQGSDTRIVDAYAAIQTKTTWGSIELFGNDSMMYNVSVSANYRYYPTIGGNAVSDYMGYEDFAYAEVTYSDSSIYHMIDATYSFRAEVPTSYGTQIFNAYPIYVRYEV